MRLDEESGLEVERRWREARAGIDESAIRVRRLQEEEKLRYKEELDIYFRSGEVLRRRGYKQN